MYKMGNVRKYHQGENFSKKYILFSPEFLNISVYMHTRTLINNNNNRRKTK